ncbi:hypothetical protein O181_131554 [Austropuccinia psidii MF-1]|uniref:Uncharacterized protein n=1 Tax=Austropuccinia psidii MF-1 TaxID=1389203 RepID=A0A9Q3L355_9BASI|nr:hypothetical protein [Austropuccinia psidii MF-1]
MLTRPQPPPDETPTLPPISALTTLQMRPQNCPPSPPSPILTLPHPRLIISLAYNPYAPTGPSSNASNTALTPPYACLHPPNPICRLPSLCSWSAFQTCF